MCQRKQQMHHCSVGSLEPLTGHLTSIVAAGVFFGRWAIARAAIHSPVGGGVLAAYTPPACGYRLAHRAMVDCRLKFGSFVCSMDDSESERPARFDVISTESVRQILYCIFLGYQYVPLGMNGMR